MEDAVYRILQLMSLRMTRYPGFIIVLIGIAHAVGFCEGFEAGDDFIVYLGDNLI